MELYIVYFTVTLFNLAILLSYKKFANILNIFDNPDNIRKLHQKPTPLIGGPIIFLNFLLILVIHLSQLIEILPKEIFNSDRSLISFFILGIAVFFVGLYDDKYSLSANSKLGLLSFLVFLSLLLNDELIITKFYSAYLRQEILLVDLSILFSMLSILLLINAYNMFDGINLQSGLYFSYIFLFFIFNNFFTEISIIFTIAVFFFLILNFNGRIFMGDSGVILISYIISFIVINSNNQIKVISAELIFQLFLVPGLDMLRLFISRLLHGKNPFKPDYNHIHHLLLRKFGNRYALIFLQAMILLPFLLNLIGIAVTYTLPISIMVYIVTIISVNIDTDEA